MIGIDWELRLDPVVEGELEFSEGHETGNSVESCQHETMCLDSTFYINKSIWRLGKLLKEMRGSFKESFDCARHIKPWMLLQVLASIPINAGSDGDRARRTWLCTTLLRRFTPPPATLKENA